ncbi:MAG: hypothetical protein KKD73_04885 [Proteobacteria bacterium]|nr:hypothetical protein [Pseudomonadota bacterium]MBU1639887.1 hypothetical protein [Pseudomonadota bacterium]
MFGIFKIFTDPSAKFDMFKGRTRTLLSKAQARFNRADQYLCGVGHGSAQNKINAAKGAVTRGHSALKEAIFNAGEAIKNAKGDQEKLMQIQAVVKDCASVGGEKMFVDPIVIQEWDNAIHQWCSELAKLLPGAYIPHTAPKIASNIDVAEAPEPEHKPEIIKAMTITQPNVYFGHKFGSELKYERLGSFKENNRYFDKYSYIHPDTNKEVVVCFDVTSFYGRGQIIQEQIKFDFPKLNEPCPVQDLFGVDFIRDSIGISLVRGIREDVESTKITFKNFSSDMISKHVAIYIKNSHEIQVAPVRCYLDKYPVLHGFNFYKLFIIHQLYHIKRMYDTSETETKIIPDYYEPVVGEDCVNFTPLPAYNFINDFLNYILWTHKPGAFFSEEERNAFSYCIAYGVKTRLFTVEEVEEAILSCQLDHILAIELLKSVKAMFEKEKIVDEDQYKNEYKFSETRLKEICCKNSSILDELEAREAALTMNFDGEQLRNYSPWTMAGREAYKQEDFEIWCKLDNKEISMEQAIEGMTSLMKKYVQDALV